MRRALTLIEVLVAIGVIGLLIALLTPALVGARSLALEAVSLNNARQCWSVVEQYADANQDAYPRCRPNTPYGPTGTGGLAVNNEVGASYLTTAHWYAVVRDIAPFHEFRPVFMSPGRTDFESSGFIVSYLFMPAFTVKGTVWTPAAQSMPPERLAEFATEVRRSEVVFPATKVGMYDWHCAYLRKRPPPIDFMPNHKTPMVFADGHAEALNPQNASDPHPNAHLPEERPRRLHDTAAGAQGRDY